MGLPDTIDPVSYDPDQLVDIINLLGNQPFKKLIWEWQFCRNAFGVQFDPVVMVRNNQVIGFNGVMPVNVRSGGNDLASLWSCDFYVDRDLRGCGVGKKIKEELHKKSRLIMAFGISPMAERVLQKMGWKKNTEVYSYARYSKIKGLRIWLQIVVQYFNRVRGYLTGFDNRYNRLQFEISDSLPGRETVNSLWNSVRDSYNNIVCRNFAYLDWRYQKHPITSYKFLKVHSHGELVALLVYRIHDEQLLVVDYLGASGEYSLKREIVAYLLAHIAGKNEVKVSTSDHDLGQALEDNGFIRLRTQPRFYIHSDLPDNPRYQSGWFIMTGDSDGELLMASQDAMEMGAHKYHTAISVAGGELTVCHLTETDLAGFGQEWSALLSRSDSDALFMSWSWLFSWWQTWAEQLKAELLLLGIYKEDALVGLAPFYKRRTRKYFGISTQRLHLIGNAWKIGPTVRTEYMGLIAEPDLRTGVWSSVLRHLMAYDWSDLVICDIESGRLDNIMHIIKGMGLDIVSQRDDAGVVIDVRQPFHDWVLSLGRNTRKKLFNDRGILNRNVDIKYYEAREDEYDYFFDMLNELHRGRWGEDCFSGSSLEFHKRLLKISDPSIKVRLSALQLDDCIQSVLYDIQVKDKVYNIQAGFNDSYNRKFSLGTLHLGYAIERAFNDDEVNQYDLLAGSGKKTFYKDRFKGKRVLFKTILLVRHPLLKIIYKGYHALPKTAWADFSRRLLRKLQ